MNRRSSSPEHAADAADARIIRGIRQISFFSKNQNSIKVDEIN
jgi:hypothetical protein